MTMKKARYPQYQNAAGWNALLGKRKLNTARPQGVRFKSIVIGAGYTGLAAARRLAELEPDDEVLVLDAAHVGDGAAGRNSGFLSLLPNRPSANRHGSIEEHAKRQMRIYKAGADWLHGLVTKHDIACDWDESSPRFSAAATESGAQSLKAMAQRYEAWGIACRTLSRDDLLDRLGTPYYQFGYHTPYNVFVQPAALIRGLAQSLPSNVHLVENLPVSHFYQGTTYKVVTAEGTFECDRLIIANNGFARHLGLLRDRLITIFTYAGLTEVLADGEREKLGREPSWGVIPAHRLGSTLRKISGGRFMLRSAYSYEREMPMAQISRLLSTLYRRRYPAMRTHQFASVWGGCTALTRNGALYFGAIRQGLYASVGCNGAGVLRGSIQGRLLAELACDEGSDLLSDQLKLEGPNWLPPEPIRKIGVLSAIAMEQRRAGLER